MPQTPEDRAREQIEQQLIAAGWVVQDARALNLIAGRGIAVREFSLAAGHGEADYLLYGNRRALGVIEAKKEGDALLFAGVSEAAKEKARALTESFAAYLLEHRDEITALQFLYSHPHGTPPSLKQLKELAAELKRPPRHWTPEALWQAYTMLEKSKVRGGKLQTTADLISLVRFALDQETVLAPFSETVNDRFAHWLSSQETAGSVFTSEQRQWLTMIRDHIAASLTVEPEDFEYVPFSERGGLGRATALFGDHLPTLLQTLTEALTTKS